MTMLEYIASVVAALLTGGGVGVAIVNAIHERRMHKLERQEKKEDAAEAQAAANVEARLKEIEDKTDAQSVALRFILYDRIRYLAIGYIEAGEVDFDDRRILRDMHHSYHNGLGGNGDLDKLMEAVDKLKLKPR